MSTALSQHAQDSSRLSNRGGRPLKVLTPHTCRLFTQIRDHHIFDNKSCRNTLPHESTADGSGSFAPADMALKANTVSGEGTMRLDSLFHSLDNELLSLSPRNLFATGIPWLRRKIILATCSEF
jgi:hypothetical protein